MKSRRIIMSDDEDDGTQDNGDNYFLSTPASSSDLVRHLTELNMKSGTKAAATTSKYISMSTTEAAGNEDIRKNQDGFQLSQNDANTSLDPESTVKIMQGAVYDDEEDEYDFSSDPFSWKAGSAPSPKAVRRPSESAKRAARKPERTTATGRPKREAATRAQAQLQSMYSEYDMSGASPHQSGEEDDESSAADGSSSTESSRDASQAGTDDDLGEAGDDSNSDAKTNTRRHHAFSASRQSAERRRAPTASSSNSCNGKRAGASAERDEASRRQSARSSRLSSRKEQQYQKARDDMQQKAAGGLDAVLLSSSGSDGEYDGVDDAEDEQDEPAANTVSQRSTSHSQSHSGSVRKSSYMEDASPVRDSRDRERGRSQGSSGRKFEPKTQYSYSMSKIKSPKSASKCMGLLHRRDEREENDEDESGESDINDFIVNSDEERAEEEARAEEAAQRRELRRQQKRSERQRKHSATGSKAKDIIAAATQQHQREQHSVYRSSTARVNATAPSDSDDAEVVPVRRTQSTTVRDAPSSEKPGAEGAGGGSMGRKRRLIVDSEDEGYAPDTALTPANKRRSVATTSGSSNSGKAGGAVDLTGDDDVMDVGGSAATASFSRGALAAPCADGSATSIRGIPAQMAHKDSPDAGSTEGSDGDSGGEGSEHGDSDTGSEGGTQESEEEEQSEEDSASDLDGPALYYKVNSMMDKREGRDEELTTITGMRKRFPVAEAMQYYVELLAHVLVDPDFLGNCHSNPKHNAAPEGPHAGGGGSSSRKNRAERDAVVQAANYVSASRQIENLLCTSRESLIGSGAWNKEFYAELQARPFYNCSRTMLCGGAGGGGGRGGGGRGDGYGDDDGSGSDGEEENIKCAACNRSTQPPDMQVFLFGSRYDARSVWNSTRWDQHVPPELLLYSQEQEEEEEGCMHESSSKSNSRGRASSSSAWDSPRTPAAASLRRNKQFQGYQTIMSGGIKRYGDAYSVQAGARAHDSSATAQAAGRSNITSKGRLRPDEAMVESWQASARKRKMIVLSDDSEEEEDGGEGARDEEDRGRGKRSKSMSREEEEAAAAAAEAEAILEANEREEEERVRSWWKQKFPREFTREKESIFFLSFHCKNRTRLYHTLLHYKFRLLMNIRARLLRAANILAGRGMIDAVDDDDTGYRRASQGGGNASGGRGRGGSQSGGRGDSQFDTSWEQLDAEDKQRLLQAAVEELKSDAVFVDQETRRFQTLISETERRYGGRDEPRHDIWGDEDESASATSNTKPSQQTQTIRKWLSKQKEKN